MRLLHGASCELQEPALDLKPDAKFIPMLDVMMLQFRVQRGLITACIMAKSIMHAYLYINYEQRKLALRVAGTDVAWWRLPSALCLSTVEDLIMFVCC